jgi:hypothetical protein
MPELSLLPSEVDSLFLLWEQLLNLLPLLLRNLLSSSNSVVERAHLLPLLLLQPLNFHIA